MRWTRMGWLLRIQRNQWLKERGVPELRDSWIKPHYGDGLKPAAKV